MSSSLAGYRGPAGISQGQNMAGANMAGDKIPKGYRKGQIQQFTPEQMQLFQQMFGFTDPDSFLARLAGGDEDLFNEIEAPAFRQFSQLQGENASRFSGMGLGARKGSGFQNYQNQATSDFAQDLQSKRQGLQRQALQDLQGFSNSLLNQRPQDNFLVEKQQKQPSGWGSLLGGLGGGAAGFLAGGPGGALAGAGLGSKAFSGF